MANAMMLWSTNQSLVSHRIMARGKDFAKGSNVNSRAHSLTKDGEWRVLTKGGDVE